MVSRSRNVKPAAAVIAASSSICGQGRSGFTWSGVSGETPPQSSMPASRMSWRSSPMRFGGAWMRALGPEDEAGDRDRGGEVRELRVGDGAHLGIRLGAEVLHDDFLDAVVLAGHLAQREDRLDALAPRLADADEDAAGERDVAAACVFQDPEADLGVLVGGAEVRSALLGEQALRRRLEHHAHRRGDRLETLEVLPGQTPGLRCGSRPVSSRTRIAIARTYESVSS